MRSFEIYLKVTDKLNEGKAVPSGKFSQLLVPVSVKNLNDMPITCYSSILRYVVKDNTQGILTRPKCLDPDRIDFKPGCFLNTTHVEFEVQSATGDKAEDFTGYCTVVYDQPTFGNTYEMDLVVTDWKDSADTQNSATISLIVEVGFCHCDTIWVSDWFRG